ncbi:hypothetical protein BDK51DRAFT_50539 [Blyttiomyces helicus]|uniref:Uncharacterized protein n=1 Tax=Blyttiomyces helicus TaxID=388810 RepID=A0A4P9VZJ6_9FUNG|nr:hypothetical protein BDK51DRAFT_50539 [Blyttiomyces helicus]|eukprot:RKO84425.1 hypothetical protein BDK51DRAFT_50539 [Blyttiomyces helicus]
MVTVQTTEDAQIPYEWDPLPLSSMELHSRFEQGLVWRTGTYSSSRPSARTILPTQATSARHLPSRITIGTGGATADIASSSRGGAFAEEEGAEDDLLGRLAESPESSSDDSRLDLSAIGDVMGLSSDGEKQTQEDEDDDDDEDDDADRIYHRGGREDDGWWEERDQLRPELDFDMFADELMAFGFRARDSGGEIIDFAAAAAAGGLNAHHNIDAPYQSAGDSPFSSDSARWQRLRHADAEGTLEALPLADDDWLSGYAGGQSPRAQSVIAAGGGSAAFVVGAGHPLTMGTGLHRQIWDGLMEHEVLEHRDLETPDSSTVGIGDRETQLGGQSFRSSSETLRSFSPSFLPVPDPPSLLPPLDSLPSFSPTILPSPLSSLRPTHWLRSFSPTVLPSPQSQSPLPSSIPLRSTLRSFPPTAPSSPPSSLRPTHSLRSFSPLIPQSYLPSSERL